MILGIDKFENALTIARLGGETLPVTEGFCLPAMMAAYQESIDRSNDRQKAHYERVSGPGIFRRRVDIM